MGFTDEQDGQQPARIQQARTEARQRLEELMRRQVAAMGQVMEQTPDQAREETPAQGFEIGLAAIMPLMIEYQTVLRGSYAQAGAPYGPGEQGLARWHGEVLAELFPKPGLDAPPASSSSPVRDRRLD